MHSLRECTAIGDYIYRIDDAGYLIFGCPRRFIVMVEVITVDLVVVDWGKEGRGKPCPPPALGKDYFFGTFGTT